MVMVSGKEEEGKVTSEAQGGRQGGPSTGAAAGGLWSAWTQAGRTPTRPPGHVGWARQKQSSLHGKQADSETLVPGISHCTAQVPDKSGNEAGPGLTGASPGSGQLPSSRAVLSSHLGARS